MYLLNEKGIHFVQQVYEMKCPKSGIFTKLGGVSGAKQFCWLAYHFSGAVEIFFGQRLLSPTAP